MIGGGHKGTRQTRQVLKGGRVSVVEGFILAGWPGPLARMARSIGARPLPPHTRRPRLAVCVRSPESGPHSTSTRQAFAQPCQNRKPSSVRLGGG